MTGWDLSVILSLSHPCLSVMLSWSHPRCSKEFLSHAPARPVNSLVHQAVLWSHFFDLSLVPI